MIADDLQKRAGLNFWRFLKDTAIGAIAGTAEGAATRAITGSLGTGAGASPGVLIGAALV